MNWRPKTDSITAHVEDGFCVLTASRRSPAETVRVVMLDISLAQALEICEQGGFLLASSEAQLQAILARQHLSYGLITLEPLSLTRTVPRPPSPWLQKACS